MTVKRGIKRQNRLSLKPASDTTATHRRGARVDEDGDRALPRVPIWVGREHLHFKGPLRLVLRVSTKSGGNELRES